MHDYDRTSLEFGELGSGDYESDEFGYEGEGETEFFGETSGESPFSEAEEMELAAELLSVNSEAELDQFIGKLFKTIGRKVGKFVKSPVGRALGGIVKSVAKQALPVLGNMVLPGVGGALGSALAGGIGGDSSGGAAQPSADPGEILGLELEGLSAEDQEFEAARQVVKFAGASAASAAEASPATPPAQAAQTAAVSAAQQYAPGLLRNGHQGRGKHRRGRLDRGTWVRHGSTIILYGVGV